MDKNSRPRTISTTEAGAAVFVLFIWSAAFVAIATIALLAFQSRTELAIVDDLQPVVLIVTGTPAATDTPVPTATALSSTASQTNPIPTPTFTRVMLPTPMAEVTGAPTPVFTSMPVPTYTYPAQIAMAQDGSTVHSVSTGETLSSIASMYGASVESLVIANHIENPTEIRVGQKLTVPNGKETASVPTASLPDKVPESNLPSNPVAPPKMAFEAGVAPPPAGDPPTRLVIPKINLDTPVVEVGWHVVEQNGKKFSEWDVADNVAGWHHGSSFPGNLGNIVVSGHHNIKGEVFRYVVDLEEGDAVHLYVGNQVYPYVVVEKYILREKGMSNEVRSKNARWIAKTTDERVTLVTCWPYSNNTHRVIVVTKPLWKQNR
jgi:LPXTG-site transpeptidase (sortase) family protein